MTNAPDTPTKLDVCGLVKRYGQRTVLGGVDLTVSRGEVVGLLGPNGAGKTTAFKLVLGVEAADSGEVRFGKLLGRMPLHKRARLGLGYLPQQSSVFAGLTVKENLVGVLKALKKKDAGSRAQELLFRFGLLHVAGQKARTLSGGERRKLEFARALCSDPQVMLVDEPFAGVDPIASAELCEMISGLARQNIGVLLTDHSVANALDICDRVYLLVNGAIVEQGTAEQIRQSPRARELYLGDAYSR